MQQVVEKIVPLALALSLGLAGVAAQAGSSSASSAASDSVGSSSTSIQKSSDSSSAKNKVAQGEYTIIEMTAVAQQPDMLRLRLQATALQTEEFFLLLPRQAVARAQLAAGDKVLAQQRAYGMAFAALTTQGAASPFFLVLDDAWYRELDSRPLAI
jgi:cystathionine beta-lyase/cystathionine gamma-synthase